MVDIPFSDIITVASIIVSVVVMYLSTKFVTKEDYKVDTAERLIWRAKAEDRIISLEKSSALSAQPLASMQASLSNIEAKMDKFLEAHLEIDARLTRMEAERDAKDRYRRGVPDTQPPYSKI